MITSIHNAIMLAIMARLEGPTPVITDTDEIRRSHKTIVTADEAVYADDGDDDHVSGDDCQEQRLAKPVVRIFVRDNDDALDRSDAIKLDVLARLNPNVTTFPYPKGVLITLGRCRFDDEVEDADAVRLDIEINASYCAPMWAPTVEV